MNRNSLRLWIAGAVWACFAPLLLAAITDQQKTKLREIDAQIIEIRRQTRQGKLAEAGQLYGEVHASLLALLADDDRGELKRLVGRLKPKLTAVRKPLVDKGLTLPEVNELDSPSSASPGGVSFTKDIAPILTSRCGQCHIRRPSGGLSMATFAALRQGSDSGEVVVPGDAKASRLVEVLESGEMPKGGNKLPANAVATIAKWVQEGARFDGTDRNAAIGRGAPAGDPTAAATPIPRPTGSETVSFLRQIAPVLIENCTTCHGASQASAQLRLDVFDSLWRGGGSGSPIVPGKPDESLIVQKLRGTAAQGQRMPFQRPPLPDGVIATIATWIKEGAAFDGSASDQPLRQLVNLELAQRLTPGELSDQRSELAAVHWKLCNPDEASNQHTTANFLIVGTDSKERLAQIGEVAEQQMPRVAESFHASTEDPLIKGRTTLFIFNRQFDYDEFARMVESREPRKAERSHWRYDGIDAYGCLVLSGDDDAALGGAITELLSGIYLDSLGRLPTWFSTGSARVLAAQANPQDPHLREWEESLPQLLRRSKEPDDFLKDAFTPAETAALNYSFVKFLMRSTNRYHALVEALRGGQAFEDALRDSYGGDARRLAVIWIRQVNAGGG